MAVEATGDGRDDHREVVRRAVLDVVFFARVVVGEGLWGHQALIAFMQLADVVRFTQA